MPRRHRHRRTMKGGFLDTLSNWGSSLTQGATSLWDKTKNAASSATSSLSGSTTSYTPTTTTTTQPMTTSTYGGKSRRRRMRGGTFKDNTPTTGLAAHAASFSGDTAQPHNLVGGRTRRRGRKHRCNKSCKRRH